MKKPTFWTGALVGLLLSVPLTVLFFLGDRVAGLPLVPYDVFDWVGRVTPGPLITFGIDTMVNTLILLGIDVAATAKTAEHILAVIGQVATGTGAVAVFFALVNRFRQQGESWPGLALGAVLGVPVALISASVNRTAVASAFVSGIWIVAAYVAWGVASLWTYDNLAMRAPHAEMAAVREKKDVSVEVLSRREFLVRVGTATAAITVVGAGVSALLSGGGGRTGGAVAESAPEGGPDPRAEEIKAAAREVAANLPNADDPVQPVAGTRPEYTPLDQHYRIDINSRPPVVEGGAWTLPITGMVNRPLALTLVDLRDNYEPMHQFVTLACISNRLGGDLTSTTLWTGASLQKVLADARVQPGAGFIEVTGADGFHESVSLDLINSDERVMLTYYWDGLPLKRQHGYPLRIYIPDRYGMKQPKWITGIEVTGEERLGYWVVRSWDHDAIMRATSVIDTVGMNMMIGEEPVVPVGGIAHAGARGISKVQVRVDGGAWQDATLRAPLSGTTWVIWRYDWPFEAGRHEFEVQCFDGNGEMQITELNSPRPSGATGIFGVTVMV